MAKFGEEVSLDEARAICDAGGVVWDRHGFTSGRHENCDEPGCLDDVEAPFVVLHDPREPQGVDLAPLRELAEEWASANQAQSPTTAHCGRVLRKLLDALPAAKPAAKTLEPGDVFYTPQGGCLQVHQDAGEDVCIRVYSDADDGNSWTSSVIVAGPLTTEPPKPKRRPKPATLLDCPTDGTVFCGHPEGAKLRLNWGQLEYLNSTLAGGRWEPVRTILGAILQWREFWYRSPGGEWVPVNGWEEA